MENDKITLARFQMFAWTWISILIYLALLFSEIYAKLENVQDLSIPDINIILVVLMGITQGAYIGSKVSTPSVFSINEVRPRDVELRKDNLIFILGSNFEKEMGTVWIEYYRPLEEYLRVIYHEEEKQKEIRYSRDRFKYQYKPEIASWEDNRIIAKLDDEVISKFDKGITLEAADLDSYDRKKSELSKAEYEMRSGTKRTSSYYKSKGTIVNAAITFGDQNEYDIKRREYEEIKTKLDKNEYVMRVEKKGLITYANGDATFRFYRASKSLNDTKSNVLKPNL